MNLKKLYIYLLFNVLFFSNASFASENLLSESSTNDALFATKSELAAHKQKLENAAKVIKIIKISEKNIQIYKNLGQAYEAEFSNLTEKVPNEKGIFSLDTLPNRPYIGYLAFQDKIPIGFCLVNVNSQVHDVAEFYIIPSMRRKYYGTYLASEIFHKYPGKWQVREIEGATKAIKFWRKVIALETNNQYEEAVVEDKDWGIVTKQTFIIN